MKFKFTNKLIEKSQIIGTNMVFVGYVLLKEANVHINFISFNRNFDHPHITVQKAKTFFHKNIVFVGSLRYATAGRFVLTF